MAASMYKLFSRFDICVLIIFISCVIAEDAPIPEKKQTDPAEQLFQRLFKQRRIEQLEAVKGLTTVTSYEKQYKMVSLVAEKVFNVIQTSRVLLENSGFIPGISDFPKDETILDALANILENTALFGDILLRLPDISHKVLNARHEWEVLLEWCLGFSKQTRLLDKQTIKLFSLVNQELHVGDRQPGYVNPYTKQSKTQRQKEAEAREAAKDAKSKAKEKKRKELKKGPRMSSSTGFRVEL